MVKSCCSKARFFLIFPPKIKNADVSEDLVNEKEQANQVHEGKHHISHSFNDDAHNLDFVEESEQFQVPDEDDHFEQLDDAVVGAHVIGMLEELHDGGQVQNLAKSLRPNSKVLSVALADSMNNEVRNQLNQEQGFDAYLYVHPAQNVLAGLGYVNLLDYDAQNVENAYDVHPQLVLWQVHEHHQENFCLSSAQMCHMCISSWQYPESLISFSYSDERFDARSDERQ